MRERERTRSPVSDRRAERQDRCLVSLGPYYLTGVPFGSVKGRLDSLDGVLDPVDIGRPEDREKNFERGFEITMSTLERAGKRVVLFIDVPELDFIPEACPGGRPVRISTSNLQSPCGVSREAVDRRQAIYRGILERLHQAHPSSRVFDPLQVTVRGRPLQRRSARSTSVPGHAPLERVREPSSR